MQKHKTEANFVKHESCPKCDSKDNLARYDDGHGYCFGCSSYFPAGGEYQDKVRDFPTSRTFEQLGVVAAITDRKISLETAKKYGVTTEFKIGSADPMKQYYPYYDNKGTQCGQKVRVVRDKRFTTSGDMKANTLFGQQLFNNEGKYVTVVEGELDALAGYELLGSRWPVVSVSKGAAGAKKDFQRNLEWLEGFENVIIAFDADEAGRIAAEECAQILSPNKAKIVNLEEFKDASDYLKHGKAKAFMQEWWNAKSYIITGVITLADAWEDFLRRGKEKIIPFPEAFGQLNQMMNGGIVAGEITVLGALTSVGKTTMVNEIVYHLWKNTDLNIGCAFLEADKGEAVQNLLTIHNNMNFSLENMEDHDLEKYKSDIITDGRIFLYDHYGAADPDEIFLKLRSMVKGNGCRILIIDPLQAGVSSNGNEVIDDFMDRLLKLAKETNVAILVVSHMRKPSATQPHNVSEYDLKGSGSINQIAFNTILLSRDKMAEGDYEKNSTFVQLVKCRRTGQTGPAGWLYYNQVTGRLEAGVSPELKAASGEDEF
jgi:twinkle protein